MMSNFRFGFFLLSLSLEKAVKPTGGFTCSERPTALATLEVVFSSVPIAHTLSEAELTSAPSSETIKIVDSYANAMLDYVLYRAYSKDAEYAANVQRAQGHYTVMQTALGTKTSVDSAANPVDVGDKTIR